MKKFAFTLSEIIIAIAIIAIVTALTLPLVNKSRPDKTKLLFLKTYDELAEAVNTLARNPEIYGDFASEGETINDFTLNPFLNTQAAAVYDKTIAGGNNKLCRALALAYTTDAPNCSDANATSLSFADIANGSVSFNSINNVDYRIRTLRIKNTTEDKYITAVMFDINGADAPNCTISANCQNPDRFVIEIYANGVIKAADIMSQYYLDTRTNPRKTDISFAALSANQNYSAISTIEPVDITTADTTTDEGGEGTEGSEGGEGGDGNGGSNGGGGNDGGGTGNPENTVVTHQDDAQ